MKLNDNFYRIHEIKYKDNSAVIKVELFPSHPIYAGHFPGQPVVPGVCTLTVIKECIVKLREEDVAYKSIKECKYISSLIPGKDIYITIAIAFDDDKNVRAIVSRANTDEAVLKLKAVLK